MIILKNKYGINIWEQEKGTELAKMVLDEYNDSKAPVIIDFDGILNVNTAFFNAFLSYISISFTDIENFSKLFKFSKMNENIQSVFSISFSFLKFKVFENEKK